MSKIKTAILKIQVVFDISAVLVDKQQEYVDDILG